MQHTQEDKEEIDKFLEAKRNFSLESETAQEPEDKDPPGKLSMTDSIFLSHVCLYITFCSKNSICLIS